MIPLDGTLYYVMPAEFICRKFKKKKYLEQNLIFERYANSSNMNQRFLKDKKKIGKATEKTKKVHRI